MAGEIIIFFIIFTAVDKTKRIVQIAFPALGPFLVASFNDEQG
jgi:hypothetical protein